MFAACGCVSIIVKMDMCTGGLCCEHSIIWCLLLVHSVVKKVAQYMSDVLEDSRDKVQENLLANGGTVYNKTSRCYFVINILSEILIT